MAARRAQGVGRGDGGALWSVWSAHGRCAARGAGCGRRAARPPGRRGLKLRARCGVACVLSALFTPPVGMRYSFFRNTSPQLHPDAKLAIQTGQKREQPHTGTRTTRS